MTSETKPLTEAELDEWERWLQPKSGVGRLVRDLRAARGLLRQTLDAVDRAAARGQYLAADGVPLEAARAFLGDPSGEDR